MSSLLVTEGMPRSAPERTSSSGPDGGGGGRGRRRGRKPGPRRAVWALLGAGLLWSLGGAGVLTRSVANPAGWPELRRFLVAVAHPELDATFLGVVGSATLVTAAYAVLGCVLALAIGLLVGPLVSRVVWRRGREDRTAAGWAAARAVLALPRGLHEAVWALLLVNVLGLNPLVAVLALGLPYGAVTAKVFADLLDETPDGAYRALLSAGAGRARALTYGLLPLAAQDLVSYAFYRLECSVRSAVVLGIVGAGGLGFQLDLSFSALRYGQMWTVLDALVLLCAATDATGGLLRRRLSCSRPGSRRDGTGRLRPRRDPVLGLAALLAVGLTAWSWEFLRVDVGTLLAARAGQQAGLLLHEAWPPAHDGRLLADLARLSVQTFQMSLLAFVLSTLAGLALSVVAARPTAGGSGPGRRAAHVLCRSLLLLVRAVPPPVWALLVLFVLYPGPLPGAIALAAYNTGVLGRLMAEGQDGLSAAPRRALRASGVARPVSWLYATLPRALPKSLVYGLYRWEVGVRETVVVGLVGAGGLGQLLARQTAAFAWPAVTSTLVALVLLTLLVDLLGAVARRAVR